MMVLTERAYSRDLNIETRRPHAPRNLVYNETTLELSWTGPTGGPRYTHFKVRLGDDSQASAFCLPIDTTRLFIARAVKVTITCWNQTVGTESDAARIQVLSDATWVGSSSMTFGPLVCYQVHFNLTVNITIVSPVESKPNRRLLIYIFQHATVEYIPSFDPADFVDSGNWHIDAAMAGVREYAGNANGKWYPVTPQIQIDPAI